jgi:hypothetical protein
MRKTRPDAAWMRLPPEAQKELASELDRKTLAEARAWLAEKHGVRMSPSALSRFYSWFHVTRTIQDSRDIASQIGAQLKAFGGGDLDDDRVNKVTQRAFELMALRRQDPKLFCNMRRLRQNDTRLELDRARFQRDTCQLFLRWYADRRAGEIAQSGSTNADKIGALRQLMFGDLEETHGGAEAAEKRGEGAR